MACIWCEEASGEGPACGQGGGGWRWSSAPVTLPPGSTAEACWAARLADAPDSKLAAIVAFADLSAANVEENLAELALPGKTKVLFLGSRGGKESWGDTEPRINPRVLPFLWGVGKVARYSTDSELGADLA